MTAPDQCCSSVRKFLPRRRPHMTQSGHRSAVSLAVTNACQVVLRLHLLVSIDKKMIEIINANESEPRIFHVCKSVKGDSQSHGKKEHVNPAARFGSGHTEASKQRSA